MYDFIILLSRYLFFIYIVVFLFCGLVFVVDERKGLADRIGQLSFIQKCVIVCMHVTGYLILSYNRQTSAFDASVMILGLAALVYFFVSNFLLKSIYKNGCQLIWNCMYFLMYSGLIMLQRLNPTMASKQLIWITVSTAMMFLIPLILTFLTKLEKFEFFYFITAIVFVILPFFLGDKEYGSLNWIKVGSMGFQPSEIVKFLFLLYIACVFRKSLNLKKLLIVTGFVGFLVLCLVLQKDLGGALIFTITYVLVLYIATSNIVILLGSAGIISGACIIAYKLFNHVRIRVATWVNPWTDVGDTGYQITQSLFAITTWGLWGSGLTRGMPGSIPVVEKDFIFAAICEEMGTFFGMGIVCIYILMFVRGMIVAVRAKKRFNSILAAGIIIMFSFQTFLILGGVIKLIPLTGVTLPFVSYGGSSVLVSVMLMGLLQHVNEVTKQEPEDEAIEIVVNNLGSLNRFKTK